jgi:hypothetical protein
MHAKQCNNNNDDDDDDDDYGGRMIAMMKLPFDMRGLKSIRHEMCITN